MPGDSAIVQKTAVFRLSIEAASSFSTACSLWLAQSQICLGVAGIFAARSSGISISFFWCFHIMLSAYLDAAGWLCWLLLHPASNGTTPKACLGHPRDYHLAQPAPRQYISGPMTVKNLLNRSGMCSLRLVVTSVRIQTLQCSRVVGGLCMVLRPHNL